VERVKIFHGNREEAFRLAQIDTDQFEVDKILAYRGDPLKRTSVEFEVKYADGQVLWVPWSQDLFQTVQYEDFCGVFPSYSLSFIP
jgi:hypothetical protein